MCSYVLSTSMVSGFCYPFAAFPRCSIKLMYSKQFKINSVDNEHHGRHSKNATGDTSERARRKCAEDILRYLGPHHQRASVPKYRLAQLQRSVRPVVRGASNSGTNISESLQRYILKGSQDVRQLATVASKYGYKAVLQLLAPQQIEIPDIEGARAAHCQLGKYPFGMRFKSRSVNQCLAILFHMAAAAGPCVGANVSLNRFDLFHGHLFYSKRLGRLGALFHALEYPAYDPTTFPVNLGYCQTGSALKYDQEGMSLRNFLWLGPSYSTNPRNGTKGTPRCSRGRNQCREERIIRGAFCVLDASEGSMVYEELVQYELQYFRTVYEGDFGDVIGDINYLISDSKELPEDRIYIC